MNVDRIEIKNASTVELIEQLSIIEERIADRTFPMSYAAARGLQEWKVEIQKELYLRKIKRNKNVC